MDAAPPFAAIEEAAVVRHGRAALEGRLVTPLSEAELAALPDARLLSLMSLRTFRAGLKHSVVDAKWSAFEAAFEGFEPAACARLADEAIEALLADKRLIRNLPKIRAVRANAAVMQEIAAERGSFARWLADWPVSDIVGLWDAIAGRFQQMGGQSAPMFLRMAGKDTFILTESVLRALVHWRVVEVGKGGRVDRAVVQTAFNAWQAATGRHLCQLSQILAASTD
jgi:3-methyladenine DNA glycosylase Tag